MVNNHSSRVKSENGSKDKNLKKSLKGEQILEKEFERLD